MQFGNLFLENSIFLDGGLDINNWYSYVQAIYAGVNIASTSFNTFNTCLLQREDAI